MWFTGGGTRGFDLAGAAAFFLTVALLAAGCEGVIKNIKKPRNRIRASSSVIGLERRSDREAILEGCGILQAVGK
jgi:hypothetical protein